MLGVALRHLGPDSEARESYCRAIELDPEFDEAFYTLEWCCATKRRMRAKSTMPAIHEK
jgi:hypothetical protein